MTAPRRRWFRFSLRTLFVVVTVLAAIWCACISWPELDGIYSVHGLPGEPYKVERRYRPPTAAEAILRGSAFTIGAGIGAGAALAIIALIVRWRRKVAVQDSPATQVEPTE
jgi:hypothetical protein